MTTTSQHEANAGTFSSSTLAALLCEVYSSVIGKGSALYCSCPITSGHRFLDWLDQIGARYPDIDAADDAHRSAHASAVIEPNRRHAREIVERWRRDTGKIVIDPTAVPHLHGWSQTDWRTFWAAVIERYASAVVFLEHWEFSNGCAFEFLVACRLRLPTCAENGEALNLRQGVLLLDRAISAIQARGGNTKSLEETRSELLALEAKGQESAGMATDHL